MRALRIIALVGFSSIAAFALWLVLVWPPPSWYRTHWPAETAFMRMRQRQARAAHDTTARYYVPVPIEATSSWLERSAIAGEDDAFFQHRGIDWHSMRLALGYRRSAFAWAQKADRDELWRALGGAWAHRERLRGASTITQQLAKNLYLSPSRNPLRKVKEAVIAYRIEMALPKQRIMALYLNIAEFGPNTWGVEAASRRYFNRPAAALSMDQAALLVATLPHPLSSNPSLRPGRTRWRQQLILRRLRGERIEVPVEEGEEKPPARDSVPAADSLAPQPDTLRVRP